MVVGCDGDDDDDAVAGAGSGAGGDGLGVCADVDNAPGSVLDSPWPAASNVGHDAVEGQTVRFHWTGSHNVLQVGTFEGEEPPTPTLGDAGWPGELRSGPKTADGSFDWNTGTWPAAIARASTSSSTRTTPSEASWA